MQGSLERVRAVMSGDQPDRPPGVYRPSPRRSGDMHAVGSSTDDWGCPFVNIQAGVIGEVREPLIVPTGGRSILPRDPNR